MVQCQHNERWRLKWRRMAWKAREINPVKKWLENMPDRRDRVLCMCKMQPGGSALLVEREE